MTRLTILGLKELSSEIIEAGRMNGCNKWQMLFKVELPGARSSLMLGINQVIMQCLAMVVIASFVGQQVLGHDLLARLQNLRLGQAFEIGVAVVFIAITLDRYSQALVLKEPKRKIEGVFWKKKPLSFSALIIVVFFYYFKLTNIRSNTITKRVYYFYFRIFRLGNKIHNYISFCSFRNFRDFLLVYFFMPTKAMFQSMPWVSIIVLVGCAGWKLRKIQIGYDCNVFYFFNSCIWILGESNDYSLYGICCDDNKCGIWSTSCNLGF